MTPQKMIKSFLKELGYNVEVRKDKNMSADILNDIIFFDKSWFENNDAYIVESRELFEKIYKKAGYKIDISQGTFAILHELGHILKSYEYKNITTRLKNYTIKVNALNDIKDNNLRNRMYRNLTLEKDADKKAYEVYNLHREKFNAFDKKLQQLIKETYANA